VKDAVVVNPDEMPMTREPSDEECVTPGVNFGRSQDTKQMLRFVSFAKPESKSADAWREFAAQRGYLKLTSIPRCEVYGSLRLREINHIANMLLDPN
jgi:hypothetical protein